MFGSTYMRSNMVHATGTKLVGLRRRLPPILFNIEVYIYATVFL